MYVCVTMQHGGDGWVETGWDANSILAESWAHGVAYAFGRAPEEDHVEVGFRGEVRRVPVNEHGWWLVMEAAGEGERFH